MGEEGDEHSASGCNERVRKDRGGRADRNALSSEP